MDVVQTRSETEDSEESNSENPEMELTALNTMGNRDEEYYSKLKSRASDHTFKIMCVGDYTGFGKKGGFLSDYIHNRPLSFYQKPTIGVDFYVHFIEWRETDKKKDSTVKLQFWDVAEHERFLKMTAVYCRNCSGALVFWGPKSPSRLSSALKWSEKVKEANSGSVPMVLVVENIPPSKRGKPMEWIGKGKTAESKEVMDRFCAKHGFAGWFELNSRYGLGYTGVMEQAVDCLVQEIFKRKLNS